MYQQQQLQSHHQHLSSKPSLPPEKQFFLQGGGDSGLILSTDAKPRLKWTPELHERFVEAVNQLGGPEKATPKTIMRLMGIPGLTLYHLKSHLQKYRLSKNVPGQASSVHHAKNVSGCRTATDKLCEGNGSPASHFASEPHINRPMHISEALQMQIEVQRRLQEQLQVQRHVQLRIEAQGKYLQSVLQKAQEALARQRSSSVHEHGGDDDDDDDDDAVFLGLASSSSSKMTTTMQQQQVAAKRLRRHHGDGSVDSCVTAWEAAGSSHNINMHTSQSQFQRGEDEGRRRRASEEYMMFLEEEPSGGASSPDDHRCDTTKRILDDDLIAINSNNSTTCRRPRADCDTRIDLNNAGST